MIRLNKDKYIASHKKQPRGKGLWWTEDRYGAKISFVGTITEFRKELNRRFSKSTEEFYILP